MKFKKVLIPLSERDVESDELSPESRTLLEDKELFRLVPCADGDPEAVDLEDFQRAGMIFQESFDDKTTYYIRWSWRLIGFALVSSYEEWEAGFMHEMHPRAER